MRSSLCATSWPIRSATSHQVSDGRTTSVGFGTKVIIHAQVVWQRTRSPAAGCGHIDCLLYIDYMRYTRTLVFGYSVITLANRLTYILVIREFCCPMISHICCITCINWIFGPVVYRCIFMFICVHHMVHIYIDCSHLVHGSKRHTPVVNMFVRNSDLPYVFVTLPQNLSRFRLSFRVPFTHSQNMPVSIHCLCVFCWFYQFVFVFCQFRI